ncbi:MAG: complex I NDUFA9 subunit family protein [Methylophilaceae bacterium]
MTVKNVSVLGGAGFVGSAIVNKLDAEGYKVKVLTRHRERCKHLILLPNVNVQTCDFSSSNALTEALKDSDAVINLIGILHESKRNSFESVHHQLPRRIAQMCEELGIIRLLHMSALRAGKYAPSKYLRSKAAGEDAINEFNKKLDITIFKPSVIFGRGDNFLNLFAKVIQFVPVLVLGKSNAKFQPIWVEDVAEIFVKSLQNTATFGKTYELGGSSVFSLRELVEKVMRVVGKKRPIIELNNSLSYLQGLALECLPGKLMTRDNVRSMEVDNVTEGSLASELGVKLTPLDAVIAEYLTNASPRGAYNAFRSAAGRAISARR